MSHNYLDTIDVAELSAYTTPQPRTRASSHAPASQVASFIDAYRQQGYRVARLDPLALMLPPDVPELEPQFHGLSPTQERAPEGAVFPSALTVRELERQLKRVYCGAIGLDCSGIRSERRRRWLFARMESASQANQPSTRERAAVLRRLVAAEMWERHVAARHEHAKRFSLEGCESLVPLLDAIVDHAGRHGVEQIFIGMPHRGRLNALVNVMGFPAEQILACLDPDSDVAATQRDLPYHRGGTARKETPHGDVTLFLAHNPSHLQSGYPVVSGMTRAFQDEHPDSPCLPLMIHGDAAFAGQGIVMETLNLTRKRGYTLGGTIHVIVNNQIGFTTPNRMDIHANEYCTDVARMIDAPVLHVNADHPDDVVRAVGIAFDYRMKHGADVVIDLIGYRRLGHSEHDIPAITQPLLQAAIASRPTVTELYHVEIDEQAPLDALRAEALANLQARRTLPDAALAVPAASSDDATPLQPLSRARLRELTTALTTAPDRLQLHDWLRERIRAWRDVVEIESHSVDWCFAENLAYASLLEEGLGIRISGMDVGRGTFMHRHAVWHSQARAHCGGETYSPLQHIAAHQGDVDIVDSPLTEEAVLGFEYGYSVQSKTRLAMWEAQFGDFVNGAQVIIDQYIASGQYKWGYQSALAVLLPHGHEGVGPEHSSGYLGRFLQLCADGNLRVVMPSTSSQWFHLLREQAVAQNPKPLIVMSPKSQLYGNRRSHSPLRDLMSGKFSPVVEDPDITTPETVTRVVLASGKFFYELQAARAASGHRGTALLRIEQLYPFPARELANALARFPRLAEIVWAQEEEKNLGAWHFVRDEVHAQLPSGCCLSDVCRTATPSGAHASIRAHQEEQRRLVAAALGLA
jgi:2-oxoglutarate dehydrogenase E1 component